MLQITQNYSTGNLSIEDVPIPQITGKKVLVRNHYSLISAGTEKLKIDTGKKNLFEKARSRPDLVKQVLEKAKKEGVFNTYQTVKARLGRPIPLGYSSAGVVEEVGPLVEGLSVGDRVACAGAGYANHAEMVCVPQNLVVRVPDAVLFKEACFTTLGSIALQGIRQASPMIGETFLVIGLGLIGQLISQSLMANGCKVLGMDIDSKMVEFAKKYGVIGVKSYEPLLEACLLETDGYGVDGVIIAASTRSREPIEVAGSVTREKGRVIVVGLVNMDVPREPYYLKEIDLKLSRSYGPGRYDPNYEEHGVDYPYGYVRFTEKRNMATFLSLLETKKVDVMSLITHEYDFKEAPKAYSVFDEKREETYLGILLKYDTAKEIERCNTIDVFPATRVESRPVGISFIGAGNYATSTLIPILQDHKQVSLRSVCSGTGLNSKNVAIKFGIPKCTDSMESILSDENNTVVFIATRHDQHADLVIRSLEANKHVFVEKPLCMNRPELESICSTRASRLTKQEFLPQLLVGFNRRFSPLTILLKETFGKTQAHKVINVRINAGTLPKHHWLEDPEQGGGRIIGECCHFIDWMIHIAEDVPVSVYAVALPENVNAAQLSDNFIISMKFKNGSIGTLTYVSKGSSEMEKEYYEVFGGGMAGVIQDFKSMELYTPKRKKIRLRHQDKGQKNMLHRFVETIINGGDSLSFKDIYYTSMTSFKVIDSISTGKIQIIEPLERQM